MKEKINQFNILKDKHPNYLLLLQIGDSYVSFNGDAKACANILGLVLSKVDGTDMEKCEFPRRCLVENLRLLIQAGKRIAVCDDLVEKKPITINTIIK